MIICRSSHSVTDVVGPLLPGLFLLELRESFNACWRKSCLNPRASHCWRLSSAVELPNVLPQLVAQLQGDLWNCPHGFRMSAHYQFRAIDVGGFGSNSVGGIFYNSRFGSPEIPEVQTIPASALGDISQMGSNNSTREVRERQTPTAYFNKVYGRSMWCRLSSALSKQRRL